MVTTINLSGTKSGTISITKIDEPYGKDTSSVASVGISLTGDANNPEWKVHIPFDNLEDVIEALQKLK